MSAARAAFSRTVPVVPDTPASKKTDAICDALGLSWTESSEGAQFMLGAEHGVESENVSGSDPVFVIVKGSEGRWFAGA